MGSSLRLSSLFQIACCREIISPLPSHPVYASGAHSLFSSGHHIPKSAVPKFQWKKLPPIDTGIKAAACPHFPPQGRGTAGASPCHLPGTNPSSQTLGTSGPSPPAPCPGRLFQPPRPCTRGTGGRLMGQVLVPGAGSCPDKVGAEIALGQYSAVATWSCGWSHLRGSREERTRGSSRVPREVRLSTSPSPLRSADRDPLLPDGSRLPSHLLPLPAPAHQLSPRSLAPGAKPRLQPPPAVNNSQGRVAFPFITLL